MDITTLALAKSYTNQLVGALPKGVVYKGVVDYYNSLPNNASIGDCYTVKYQGTSGTTADGNEYVWGAYEGTNQWILIGGQSSGGGAERFVATYNVTSFSDIDAAFKANKEVYCYYPVFQVTLPLMYYLGVSQNAYYLFGNIINGNQPIALGIGETGGWSQEVAALIKEPEGALTDGTYMLQRQVMGGGSTIVDSWINATQLQGGNY